MTNGTTGGSDPQREGSTDTRTTAPPTENGTATVHPTDLMRFRLDCLRVIERDGPTYGLAIKDALEELYDEVVNHGRLYPNLDALVEMGLVAKSARDKRTNEYALTDAGQQLLAERRLWLTPDVFDASPQDVADAGGGEGP